MYEPGTTRLLHKYLKEGDKCVIAGAHQGYFAKLAASIIGSKGRVYAFEPEPKNFAILKENTLPFDNIRIFNFALGEKAQKAQFFFNSDNDGGHALWDVRKMKANHKSRENPVALEVEIKRLDDVLEDEELSRMKLMLFDVEGSEHSVLKGAINTIVDNRVPNIIVEINNGALNQCLTSQMELRSYMGLYGYKSYFVNENDVAFIPPTEDIHLKVSSDGEENVENVFNVLFKHLTAG